MSTVPTAAYQPRAFQLVSKLVSDLNNSVEIIEKMDLETLISILRSKNMELRNIVSLLQTYIPATPILFADFVKLEEHPFRIWDVVINLTNQRFPKEHDPDIDNLGQIVLDLDKLAKQSIVFRSTKAIGAVSVELGSEIELMKVDMNEELSGEVKSVSRISSSSLFTSHLETKLGDIEQGMITEISDVDDADHNMMLDFDIDADAFQNENYNNKITSVLGTFAFKWEILSNGSGYYYGSEPELLRGEYVVKKLKRKKLVAAHDLFGKMFSFKLNLCKPPWPPPLYYQIHSFLFHSMICQFKIWKPGIHVKFGLHKLLRVTWSMA